MSVFHFHRSCFGLSSVPIRVASNLVLEAMSDLLWSPAELPSKGLFRPLKSLDGDPDYRSRKELPVEAYRSRIADCLSRAVVVAVQASPGSGKSMILPSILLDQASSCNGYGRKNRTLIVQSSNVTAMQFFDSFCCDGRTRSSLHLQLTEQDETPFDIYTHEISIITYDILSNWLSSSGRISQNPLTRYSAIFLDDFRSSHM